MQPSQSNLQGTSQGNRPLTSFLTLTPPSGPPVQTAMVQRNLKPERREPGNAGVHLGAESKGEEGRGNLKISNTQIHEFMKKNSSNAYNEHTLMQI